MPHPRANDDKEPTLTRIGCTDDQRRVYIDRHGNAIALGIYRDHFRDGRDEPLLLMPDRAA